MSERPRRARVIVESSDGVSVIEGAPSCGALELLQAVAGEVATACEHVRGDPPFTITAEEVPADTPMMTTALVRKATGTGGPDG